MPACCTKSDKSQPLNPKKPTPYQHCRLTSGMETVKNLKGVIGFYRFLCFRRQPSMVTKFVPVTGARESGVRFFFSHHFLWHSQSLLMKATKINAKTFPRQLWLVEFSFCKREKRQYRGFCQGELLVLHTESNSSGPGALLILHHIEDH